MLSLRCRINANVAELLVIIVYTGRDPRLYLPRHRPPLSSLLLLSLSLSAASFQPIGVTIDRDPIYGSRYRPTEAILVWLDRNIHGWGNEQRQGPSSPLSSTTTWLGSEAICCCSPWYTHSMKNSLRQSVYWFLQGGVLFRHLQMELTECCS